MTFSACWIVKNEAANIQSSILSVRDCVEECIVVDTGSTDDTVAISENCGAKTYHFQWINDFSAAKNYALSLARGEYVIFLDADEYFAPALTKKDTDAFVGAMSGTHADVLQFKLTDIEKVGGGAIMESFAARVFRRETIHFENRIHEIPLLENGAFPKVIDFDGCPLFHTGYSDGAHLLKEQRNVAILEEEREELTDPFKLFCNATYLTREHLALKHYNKATRYCRYLLKHHQLFKEACDTYGYPYILQIYNAIQVAETCRGKFSRQEIHERLFGAIKECYPGTRDALLADLHYQIRFHYHEGRFLREFKEAEKNLAKTPRSGAIEGFQAEIKLFKQAAEAAHLRGESTNARRWSLRVLKNAQLLDLRPLFLHLYQLKGGPPEKMVNTLNATTNLADPSIAGAVMLFLNTKPYQATYTRLLKQGIPPAAQAGQTMNVELLFALMRYEEIANNPDILTLAANDLTYAYYLAYARIMLGDYEQAAAVLLPSLEQEPKSQNLLTLLLVIAEKADGDLATSARKRYEDGIAALDQWIEQNDADNVEVDPTDYAAKISACWIVKNEENNLKASIESVRDCVGELIIVDTGSTDGTIRVASENGARVEHFDWIDDFAAAKNYALSLAANDYVIFLDGDESFTPALTEEDAESFCKIFGNTDTETLQFTRVEIDSETGAAMGKTTVDRVLRRDAVHFENRIHELPKNADGDPPRTMPFHGLEVAHNGYSKAVYRKKLERNIKILEAEQHRLTDPLKRFLNAQYLLREHLSLGNKETAVPHCMYLIRHSEHFAAACKLYNTGMLQRFFHAMEVAAGCRYKFSRQEIFDKLVGELKKIYPGTRESAIIELYYQLLFHYREGEFLRALLELEPQLEQLPLPLVPDCHRAEAKIFTRAAEAAHLHGNDEQAARWAVRALLYADAPDVRLIQLLLYAKRGDPPEEVTGFLNEKLDLSQPEMAQAVAAAMDAAGHSDTASQSPLPAGGASGPALQSPLPAGGASGPALQSPLPAGGASGSALQSPLPVSGASAPTSQAPLPAPMPHAAIGANWDYIAPFRAKAEWLWQRLCYNQITTEPDARKAAMADVTCAYFLSYAWILCGDYEQAYQMILSHVGRGTLQLSLLELLLAIAERAEQDLAKQARSKYEDCTAMLDEGIALSEIINTNRLYGADTESQKRELADMTRETFTQAWERDRERPVTDELLYAHMRAAETLRQTGCFAAAAASYRLLYAKGQEPKRNRLLLAALFGTCGNTEMSGWLGGSVV